MARSPDGSEVFVTGKSSSERTDYDAATVAYDANTGATLWVSRFDDPAHTYGEGKAVAVSPDGSEVFITGTMGGNPGTIYADYLTVAYDAATGALLWYKRFDGPAHSADNAYAVAVSLDGARVFVTGGSRGSPIRDDWATIAYDAAAGTPLWLKRLGGPNHGGVATAMAMSPDGTMLLVTGSNVVAGNNSDLVTWPTTPPPDPAGGSRPGTAPATTRPPWHWP